MDDVEMPPLPELLRNPRPEPDPPPQLDLVKLKTLTHAGQIAYLREVIDFQHRRWEWLDRHSTAAVEYLKAREQALVMQISRLRDAIIELQNRQQRP